MPSSGEPRPRLRLGRQTACQHLAQGRLGGLLAAITALSSIPPPPGHTRSIAEQALSYFTTNAARMDYPTFRAQRMHIGNGIAEAAYKIVVATRAKHCAACVGLQAEASLRL